LRALVESSDLWDGRDVSVQVLDISDDRATLRAAVSARNAGELWDLQCLVREDFIKFLSEEHPHAMNVMRIESLPPEPTSKVEASETEQEAPAKSEKPSARRSKPWDLNTVPDVDNDEVESWRSQEPPVEVGWIPTVQRKNDDGLV